MKSKAITVENYINELNGENKCAIIKRREIICKLYPLWKSKGNKF